MNLEPGFFYHIYNRGNDARRVFINRENYLFFLRKMKEHLSPFVSFVSWCLMPNHFHIIVYVHKNQIEIDNGDSMTQSHAIINSKDSQQNSHTLTSSHSMTKKRTLNYSIGILLRSYTRAIQKQERFSGSLFQQHTNAKPLIDEIKIDPSYWNTAFGTLINISEGKSYLETCIEYIHHNPVYSGLVKSPEDWEFSSFRDFLGLREGKLIDYELLQKEGLLNKSHSMTLNHTMTNTCIIGIGSNINAEANISKMIEILRKNVEIEKVSTMIQTKPIGIENQPDFTNGAVKINTVLNKNDLTVLLKSIEDQLGRDRTVQKFGPRCIDLDVVVWNGEIVDDDYYTRDFLQKSVDEIS